MSEAQDAPLCVKDGVVSLSVDSPDGAIEISRVPDASHRLTDERAHTSRPTLPALLQPLVPVAGVVPLGELELIDALSAPDIVVADGRKRDQYAKYSIPSAVTLSPHGGGRELLWADTSWFMLAAGRSPGAVHQKQRPTP